MHTAYSYVRFSSKPQELGDSLRRQVKLAREYAAKHNLLLDESSYQDLGISAFKGKNAVEGALAAFLKAVDDKIIPTGSYLLVESLDRVSRASVMDALHVFQSIIKRGITLVTLQDQQVYSKATIDENWTKLIMALAVMARANEESATKSRRVKSAWDGKRERGEILTAMGPSWLELNKERTKWLPIKEKVEVVHYVFKLAADGLGAPTIANKLNDDQIDTMGSGKTKAEYWEPGVVMALLKNRSVIGTFTPKKAKADPIEGYYPVIIKPDVFYTVQEHIAKRRGTGGQKGTNLANLFAGNMFCECGSKVRYVSASKPHLYLRCKRAYSNVGCDAPQMPYTQIEKAIITLLQEELPLHQEVLEDPTIVLRGELESKRKLLATMVDALKMADDSRASLPTLVASMLKLEGEVAALERELRNVVLPRPLDDAHAELENMFSALKKLLKAKNTDDEVFELRLKMQAQIKRLLSRIVLLKETHSLQADMIATSTDPEEMPELLAMKDIGEYRKAVLYGPFADRFIKSDRLIPAAITQDGGLVLEYILPPWGINGTRRRVRKA